MIYFEDMAKEINWTKQLRNLEKYCIKKGFTVIYKSVDSDSIYLDEKKIVISTSHNDEIAFYSLLHEMGHAVLVNRKETYEKQYNSIFENFNGRSLVYKVTILFEELDAWKEGLKLAKTLNLKVDRRKYEINKAKCLSTYINWIK